MKKEVKLMTPSARARMERDRYIVALFLDIYRGELGTKTEAYKYIAKKVSQKHGPCCWRTVYAVLRREGRA